MKASPASRTNWLKSWIIFPLSIRAKITLPYLFLAIVLAIATSFMVTQIVFDTVEERFINQLVELGKLASEVMVIEENHLLATLRLLANTKGLSDALQQGDADKLRELTFGTILNYQEGAVEFLDASGRQVLSVQHRQGGNIEEYVFSSKGTANLNWDFVQKIYNRQADRLGDKYSGYVHTDWGDYFYVAGPVVDQNGKLVGVVLVGTTMQTLTRKLREETLAQITFYELGGKVVASTFINPAALPASTAQEVIHNQDQSSFRRDMSRELSVQNIGYQEILGPWEGRGDTDLGVMGVSLGKSFLVSATRVTRIQASLLILTTLLIIVLVGIYLSYFITHPIKQLVRASQKVAGGDFQVQVEPTTRDELSVLIQSFNQMVTDLSKSKTDLLDSYDHTLAGWSKALELRDKETLGHTTRVTELTIQVARHMGMSEEQIEQIRRGALLHDIGKMGIPDSILLKPGKLDEEEMAVIRLHPVYAYEMLKHIDYLRPALAIPYCHHERWDGTGYPRGLKGEEIPLEARIFTVVDVWDAVSNDRPYREAMSQEEVVEIIKSQMGTYFDPRVAEEFLELVIKGMS